MTNLRCEIEKELSMVAQRAGSEEVTNGRGDKTLINWNPSLEDKFVTKTRDQPEPGSFFPRSLWGGEMKDPGNDVAQSFVERVATIASTENANKLDALCIQLSERRQNFRWTI